MKKYLFVLLLLIILGSFYQLLAGNRTGYLKKNLYTDNPSAEIYFGSHAVGGRVHVWTDKTDGRLYSDPEKTVEYGYAENPASLSFTGKKKGAFYEAVIKPEIPKGQLAETLHDALGEYEKKYYEQCSTCHAAAEFNRYNRERWEGILKSMQQHSGISAEEIGAIRRYILLSITN